MTTPEILRQWRANRSQTEAAEILGIRQGYYSRLESGLKQPGKFLIIRLVELTGCPAEVFLRQEAS